MTSLKKRLKTLVGDSRLVITWALAAMLLTWGAALLVLQYGYDSAAPAEAASVSPGERARMETVIRDYLLSHPEIIPEAVKRLQERQVSDVIETNREAIETPFEGAWAGAKDGDVVLVEFFDYACPYCKASVADVKRLLAEDPKLKVVWRDFPVLGDNSREAAMASLSAARQGHYADFYTGLFDNGRPDRANIIAAVREAGMNEVETGRDLKSAALRTELENNLELGRALGLSGTPSYVVGGQVLNGAVGYETLKAAIAKAREKQEG